MSYTYIAHFQSCLLNLHTLRHSCHLLLAFKIRHVIRQSRDAVQVVAAASWLGHSVPSLSHMRCCTDVYPRGAQF